MSSHRPKPILELPDTKAPGFTLRFTAAQLGAPPRAPSLRLTDLPDDLLAKTLSSYTNAGEVCDAVDRLSRSSQGVGSALPWRAIAKQYAFPILGEPGPYDKDDPAKWRDYVFKWCRRIRPGMSNDEFAWWVDELLSPVSLSPIWGDDSAIFAAYRWLVVNSPSPPEKGNLIRLLESQLVEQPELVKYKTYRRIIPSVREDLLIDALAATTYEDERSPQEGIRMRVSYITQIMSRVAKYADTATAVEIYTRTRDWWSTIQVGAVTPPQQQWCLIQLQGRAYSPIGAEELNKELIVALDAIRGSEGLALNTYTLMTDLYEWSRNPGDQEWFIDRYGNAVGGNAGTYSEWENGPNESQLDVIGDSQPETYKDWDDRNYWGPADQYDYMIR